MIKEREYLAVQALLTVFPFFLFIMSLATGFYSLSKKVNKWIGGSATEETTEGIISDLIPQLSVDIKDDELLDLTALWKKNWGVFEGEIRKRQKVNEEYWLGQQFHPMLGGSEERPRVDNLIFENLETFLPIATAQNPESIVLSDDTTDGDMFAEIHKDLLVYHADRLRIRLKLKKVARFWALYLLGCAKVTWSQKTSDIAVAVIRPQKLILDPDATINEDMEYTGEYIGEYRSDSAKDLIERFPLKKAFIKEFVDKNLGTKLRYIEWWTDEIVFLELEGEFLDKKKNPHFLYYDEQEAKTVRMGNGQTEVVKLDPYNHFTVPKKPYIFLSIFSLDKHPYDETSLIEQNLSAQDEINKRLRQIDKNVDNMNGGWGISGEFAGLTKEDAAKVIQELRKGGGIYVPQGDINQAVAKFTGPSLPPDVYQSVLDTRSEMRNIFGVRGSTPEGISSEQTVRGKIINKGQDQGRIGGGITEYLEQFADQLYNWFVQMMYVYYDKEHIEGILGRDRVRMWDQLVVLSNKSKRKLTVSVKEGSLIPKDEVSKRNEAIDLWTSGALDPITLFKRLDFPNPEETARKLFLWQRAPELLFEGDTEIQQIATLAKMSPQGEGSANVAPATTTSQVTTSPAQGTPPSADLSQVPIQ